jgi:chemotaxis protein CheD
MPDTGQAMVKKLRLQQEPNVAEREQALAKQVAEARAARHARAARERGQVELFAAGGQAAVPKPRIELFGTPAAKPRIELFGANARSTSSINSAKTVEEA